MLNHDDLLAISCLLDTKLEPIKAEQRATREDIRELKTDVRVLQADVAELKTDVCVLKTDVSNLQTKVGKLEVDVHGIHIKLENDISPRMQNIENCYVSTYERYRDKADQVDGIRMDVDILKKVTTEHSRAIQSIS